MKTLKIIGAVAVAMGGVFLAAGCKQEVAKAAPTPPAVTVAVPIEREVRDYDEYTGKLKEVDRLEVRARVRGYLKSVGFKDGDLVTKDQMLFQIDPAPFEAQVKIAKGQLNQVKARKTKAEADVNRYKDLVPKAPRRNRTGQGHRRLGEARRASSRRGAGGGGGAETWLRQAHFQHHGVASKANLPWEPQWAPAAWALSSC